MQVPSGPTGRSAAALAASSFMKGMPSWLLGSRCTTPRGGGDWTSLIHHAYRGSRVVPDTLVTGVLRRLSHAAAADDDDCCWLCWYGCSVADTFYDKLKQRAHSIKIGDPLQPGCRMGPVVSAAQYDRVRHYVQVCRGDGAGRQRYEGIRTRRQAAGWGQWSVQHSLTGSGILCR